MTHSTETNMFLTGWLPGVFAKTAAPIIVITTVNGLFAVVDAYFLGVYVGAAALSAVSLIFPALMLLVALQTLVSNGMANILARRLGAGDRAGARTVFTSAHALAIAVVIAVNLVYWLVGRQVIALAAAGNTDVAQSAEAFMGVMIAFAPVSFFLSLHIDGLRCEGKLGFMTLVMLASTLLNILANWLLMAVAHWGVVGSAGGSILAQFTCLAIILAYRLRRPSALSLDMKLHLSEWRGIFAYGAPMSLGFIGISLSSAAILFNLSIWHEGNYVATVGAYGIVTRVMTFAYLPLLGLSIALQTISGHNHGAALPARVAHSVVIAMVSALVYCAAVELIVEMLAGHLGSIFVADPVIVEEVGRILPWTIGAYFLFGQAIILSSYFQSIGDARRGAIFGLSRSYLFALPLTFLLPLVFGERGIWMTPIFAEAGMILLTWLVLSRNARDRKWRYGLLPT
ncbi:MULTISPECIES: MATE family efflux transporter [unclassified Rhizobium]|uniref:MATE family efflux transporter n=1 Tax=unclassified Rhizobium TaxID=2613769 RepID=UPI000EA8C58D|nr:MULTISPECIES: MATE family efflux transporter [unclassified Rhizobium]AYG65628.1 MATE family efflux transporter [Rhizobium sp. CCGE531]AYG72110.1 MATE family efflux transporter [Rhizobium sp. CCGE532]